jgi:hypothetical protein
LVIEIEIEKQGGGEAGRMRDFWIDAHAKRVPQRLGCGFVMTFAEGL